ncbi:MAG: DUF962 domain-containing protein [Burkholderiales bacterium]|nr:DUF962 domain-containing protein [Burkholderiales bacterium]
MRATETPSSPHAQPAATQRRVDQLLAHYGESHQHPTNERIHFVAIPMIMLSLIGLIYSLHPWAAYAFVAASMVYYVRLSAVFLVAMGLVTWLMLTIVHRLDAAGMLLAFSIAAFVVAWIFQFIGHKVEGKKPSFFEDIQYLWVGPLFVLSKLFVKLGIRW